MRATRFPNWLEHLARGFFAERRQLFGNRVTRRSKAPTVLKHRSAPCVNSSAALRRGGAGPSEWHTATGCLIGTAEGRDFLMHARIGMLRALNRHVERVFNPDGKDTHWGSAS
jgi:hypothetical protein